MAEIYKGVFEDDKGNRYYAASDTEITYDTAGIPLNNGGDLSEASVNFTVSSSRKALTAKARFKALMGDIAKWLTDLGPAAFYKVADDFTTTAENYLFTARKGKQLKDEVDNLNQNLNGYKFDVIDGIPSYKAGADAAWVPFSNPEVYFAQYSFPGDQSTIPFTLSKAQLWLLTNGNWFTQYQNQLKLQINGATVPVASYTKYNNCYIAKYDTKQYINSAASLLVNRSMVVANAYTYIMLIGV
ncbi:hypothetical protein [Eisenbergiella massiliensis]|uniref:hypothetical protein n=1 Tax=Eisenbergiella massiliensis TaxID=1720294 RepID=UPI00399AD5C6